MIGKPVYAGGPLRAGAGDGREGGALPHTPASPENSQAWTIHKLGYLKKESMFFGAAYRAKKRRHKFKKRSFVDSSGEKPRSHNRLGYLHGTNAEK